MAHQKIIHGATIDTSTPSEVAEIVARAFARQKDRQFHTEKAAIILGAGGSGQTTKQLPRLFGWLMQRITVLISPAGVATVNFFQDDVNGSDLRETISVPASGLYSDSFDNVLYMPPGSTLIVVVSGGTAASSVSFNLQCELTEAAQG